MAITNPKKASGRRKKKDPSSGDSSILPSISTDIVEIERNMIENWFIQLRHWVYNNQKIASRIMWGVISSAVFALIMVFVQSGVVETHNSRLFSLFDKYEDVKGSNLETLSPLLEEAEGLCNALWSTPYSNNGCLIAAAIQIDLNNMAAAAKIMEEYADNTPSNAMEPFSVYLSANIYERSGDLNKALELVTDLAENYSEGDHYDAIFFKKGRLEFATDNKEKALETFEFLTTNFPQSPYNDKARQYTRLIQLP